MRKIKNPKIGEYVLLTKYSDKDFNDPAYIGLISEILITKNGKEYKCEGSNRFFKHCFRITEPEGRELLADWGTNESEEV